MARDFFKRKRSMSSSFRFLRTTEGRIDDLDEPVQEFVKETGREFIEEVPAFHEGFVNDVTDLFVQGEDCIYNLPQVRQDVINAYATNYVDNINDAHRKQLAQQKFLKNFAASDMFKSMKSSLTTEEAVKQTLELLRQAAKQPDPTESNGEEGDGKGQGKAQPGKGKGSKKDQQSTGNTDAEDFEKIMDNAQNLVDAVSEESEFETLQSFGGQGDDEKEKARIQRNGLIAGKGTADPKSLIKFIKKILSYHEQVYKHKINAKIFHLARKLKLMAKSMKGWDFEPDPVAENMRVRNMTNYNQVPKVLPVQLAQDDDLFYLRYAKKDLQIMENVHRKDKTQILHILVDGSGSMGYGWGNQQGGDEMASCIVASSIAISFLRSTIDNGDKFLMRFFDGSPKSLIRVDNKEDARKAIQKVVHESYSGGGTSISSAVAKAIQDIIDFRKGYGDDYDFGKAEILLISDGCDHIDGAAIKEKLKQEDIKLNSIIIQDDISESVKEASNKYFKVPPEKFAKEAGDLVKDLVEVNEEEEREKFNKLI